MKFRLVLAAALALIALSVTFTLARAEAGYASPQFQLRGPVSLDCLDASPQPNLYDRTQDTFACVGPADTTTASGTLWQAIYVRYRRFYSWGEVTWRCVPVRGSYDRYVHAYTNLACSRE